MVDTGAEMTWLPEADLRSAGVETFKRDQLFVMANGQYVTRHVGMAVIECGEFKTVVAAVGLGRRWFGCLRDEQQLGGKPSLPGQEVVDDDPTDVAVRPVQSRSPAGHNRSRADSLRPHRRRRRLRRVRNLQ